MFILLQDYANGKHLVNLDNVIDIWTLDKDAFHDYSGARVFFRDGKTIDVAETASEIYAKCQ